MRIPDAASIPFRIPPALFVEPKPIAPARPVTVSRHERSELRRAADRLIAGQVSGPIGGLIDITVSDRGGSIPLQPRPADRHAAATGVELGRRIDLTA